MTLPFYWHSGILLIPLTMLLCGTMTARRRGPAVSDPAAN